MFAVLSTTQFYLKEAVNLAAQQAKKNGRDPKTLKVALAFENDPFSQDVRAGVAAVLTFVNAFQRSGSLDPEKLRMAIAATNMQTFYDNIKFDSTGKKIAKPMVLFQIQGG